MTYGEVRSEGVGKIYRPEVIRLTEKLNFGLERTLAYGTPSWSIAWWEQQQRLQQCSLAE